MTTKKIYLTMASAGRWEDYRDWPMKAFSTRDAAEAYAQSLRVKQAETYDYRKNDLIDYDVEELEYEDD